MTKFSEINIDTAFSYIKNRLFNPDTRLIYDHAHARCAEHFPTPDEVAKSFPNPCGYSVGMEDGMINGGTAVDFCLLRYKIDGDKSSLDFARELVKGMLNCVKNTKSEGYVPRGVTIIDGKSCYCDSSIDQYTMFVFGMMRFFESGNATSEEIEEITKAVVSVARRAKNNPTPENGYDLLRDDGGKSIVSRIWGDARGNHERLRLPMIFAAAYRLTGDSEWKNLYEKIIDEGIGKSLPMTDYWHLYTLQQMQASIYVCKMGDDNCQRREALCALSDKVAQYAKEKVLCVENQLDSHTNYNAPYAPFRSCSKDMVSNGKFTDVGFPDAFHPERKDAHEFFTLQDAANIAVILGFSDNVKADECVLALFAKALSKIDFNIHERCVPVHFVDGYYRLKGKNYAYKK